MSDRRMAINRGPKKVDIADLFMVRYGFKFILGIIVIVDIY